MADRQSASSQNVNSKSYDQRKQRPLEAQQPRQNVFNKSQKSQPSREAQRFEVTNQFRKDDRRQPLEVVFCKYNPLHVITISIQKQHEGSDCPDRWWEPGEEIVKYQDLEGE